MESGQVLSKTAVRQRNVLQVKYKSDENQQITEIKREGETHLWKE